MKTTQNVIATVIEKVVQGSLAKSKQPRQALLDRDVKYQTCGNDPGHSVLGVGSADTLLEMYPNYSSGAFDTTFVSSKLCSLSLLVLSCKVLGVKSDCLVDSGVMHNFISQAFLDSMR